MKKSQKKGKKKKGKVQKVKSSVARKKGKIDSEKVRDKMESEILAGQILRIEIAVKTILEGCQTLLRELDKVLVEKDKKTREEKVSILIALKDHNAK